MNFPGSCNANRPRSYSSLFFKKHRLANLLLHVSCCWKCIDSPCPSFIYLFNSLSTACFLEPQDRTLWSPRSRCDSAEGRRGAAEANALPRRTNWGHTGGTYAVAVCAAVMTAWCRSALFIYLFWSALISNSWHQAHYRCVKSAGTAPKLPGMHKEMNSSNEWLTKFLGCPG